MLIAVWIITIAVIVGIGIYSGTKVKSADEWSGGDRSMSAAKIGFMYCAYMIGGTAVVGAAQDGYNIGISGFWYGPCSAFFLLFMAAIAKLICTKMKGVTVPAYLDSRYDKKTSRVYTVTFLVNAFLYIPLQLITVSSIIKIAIPNLNMNLALFVGLLIAVLYTGFSGIRGASSVGTIASIGIYVLLVGFVTVTLISFGGFSAVLSEVPPEYSSPLNIKLQKIVAWCIGGCLSTAVKQTVIQPILSAKNPATAQRGAVLGYIFAAPLTLFTAFCGIFAAASGVDLGNGSTAFAWTIKQFSSPWFAGIIFAFATMIIAATMSTMMLATGTILTNLYKTDINPQASDSMTLKMSKILTFVFSFVSLIPALLLPSDSITSMFLTIQHVSGAPASFAILGGMLWKKCSSQGAFWSMLSGVTVGVLWMVLGLTSYVEALYPTVLVTYVVGILVSLATYKKEGLAG